MTLRIPASTLPRRLDQAESFFWFLDHLSPMNFAVMAIGTGRIDEALLKNALDSVQSRHELLSAAIDHDNDGRLMFKAQHDFSIPITTVSITTLNPADVNKADWQVQLAPHIIRQFPLGQSPLARAVLLANVRGDWVLSLIFHHAIADARSAFTILDETLTLLQGLPLQPPPDARPPLSYLYRPELSGTSGKKLVEQLAAHRQAMIQRTGVPERQAHHLPHNSSPPEYNFFMLELARPSVEHLVRMARDNGTSLTGALGAIQLISLRRLFGDDQTHTLGLTCAADLRASLAAELDNSNLGLYATLISNIQHVGDIEDLWPLARRLTDNIHTQLKLGAAHLFYDFMPKTNLLTSSPADIDSFRGNMATLALSTSVLSNAGQLAPLRAGTNISTHRRLFALCPTQMQPVLTAVCSDETGLILTLNFNQAQFSSNAATEVLKSMATLLSAAN